MNLERRTSLREESLHTIFTLKSVQLYNKWYSQNVILNIKEYSPIITNYSITLSCIINSTSTDYPVVVYGLRTLLLLFVTAFVCSIWLPFTERLLRWLIFCRQSRRRHNKKNCYLNMTSSHRVPLLKESLKLIKKIFQSGAVEWPEVKCGGSDETSCKESKNPGRRRKIIFLLRC